MEAHSGTHAAAGAVPPLGGFTVAVTAARRADELAALLERRGAAVLRAPSLRIVPLSDDAELLDTTRQLLDDAPDVVVATTAIGFRGWIEAADGWGLGEALLRRLGAAELLARGPKVRGAVRAAGLTETWSPASESMAEVLERLMEEGVEGRRVAIQLHGEPLPGFSEALRAAGRHVVTVPVYRWMLPEDLGPVDRLLDAVFARALDAVTFTSAPACCLAAGAGRAARAAGRPPRRLPPGRARRLRRTGHRAAAPVAGRADPAAGAVPAGAAGAAAGPRAARIGAATAGRRAPDGGARARRGRRRGAAARPAGLHGAAAGAGPPAGWVVGRADLLRALPGAGRDEHAVETAMARLRTALGAPKLVQTVVKRGYRLALDPRAEDKYGSPH